ncbi:MAG: PAS domain-containing sensor histidine kinase [Saprospiraceae bacterium]
MDIYSKQSRWKIWLSFGAVLIVIASLLYTNSVASRLADSERERADLLGQAIVEINKMPEDPDCVGIDPSCLHLNTDFIFSILEGNKTIPVILTDERKNIQSSINLNEEKAAADTSYLPKQLRKMMAQNEPIIVDNGFDKVLLFYKNSKLLTLLIYFPYFQLGLIIVFLFMGYLAISAARRAEQNQVWVGLAKETAHQLGTPITAIVAWIENLKLIVENDMALGMLDEFRNDVSRLELIAERFSKIGAVPELKPNNVIESIEKNMAYMNKRASRRIKFDFPTVQESEPITAKLNPNLFDWVLENLLKNALDAMEGKGSITATAFEDDDYVYIDIEDTGKGIPSNKFNSVFKPGYSTKKRGWGLGLSLTQRIINNYHNGKVFVKQSEVGVGTTFRIQLPK